MMKKLFFTLLFAIMLSALSAPAFAACAVSNLQVKDNAGTTALAPYADDGSGGSNCSPQIQIKQGGNVLGITAGNAAKVDGSATTQPVSGTVTVTGVATKANQDTNSATTSHTCSTGGYSELGCLGQIDDDVKATGTIQGNVNVTLTDCSGSISTGGTAQNAFTAQTTLHGFTIANIDASSGSGEDIWISFTTTAAAATAGSFPLVPIGGTIAGPYTFTAPLGMGTGHALSVIATTTGHKFSCSWW